MLKLPQNVDIDLNGIDKNKCQWTIVTEYLKNKYGYSLRAFSAQMDPENNVLKVSGIIWNIN